MSRDCNLVDQEKNLQRNRQIDASGEFPSLQYPPSPAKSRQKLTVATYNVHSWIGKDGRKDPKRAIEVIRNLNADIIALQEISFTTKGLILLSTRDLAEATGMRVIPGITLHRQDGEYGNVLRSAYPYKEIQYVDLRVNGREPRGAIIATLDLLPGSPERVVATHLGLRKKERHIQSRRLIQRIDHLNPQIPLILMGDFNEWNPLSRTIRILRSNFAPVPISPAYPSRFPILSLDRIFLHTHTTTARIRTYIYRSPLSRMASDHLPVKAVIEFL